MSLKRQIIGSETQEDKLLTRQEWEKQHLTPGAPDNNAENDLNEESLGVGVAYIVESAEMIFKQIQNRISSIKSRIKKCLKSFI